MRLITFIIAFFIASPAFAGLTKSAQSGAGDFVQVVGVAVHADRILLNIDLTLVEVSS